MKRELPRIISVDDHVIEPAHVWQRGFPRSIGPTARASSVGASARASRRRRRIRSDVRRCGPPADCWIYEDKVWLHRRMMAAVGFPRDEMNTRR